MSLFIIVRIFSPSHLLFLFCPSRSKGPLARLQKKRYDIIRSARKFTSHPQGYYYIEKSRQQWPAHWGIPTGDAALCRLGSHHQRRLYYKKLHKQRVHNLSALCRRSEANSGRDNEPSRFHLDDLVPIKHFPNTHMR